MIGLRRSSRYLEKTLKMSIPSRVALLSFAAIIAGTANAAPVLSNAVAIQPVGVHATSVLAPSFTETNAIDQVGLSAHYVSGATPASAIDSISAVSGATGWHGKAGAIPGSIVFDLGSSYLLDRVFLYWANDGQQTNNNIADFTVDVTNDPGFTSLVMAATFGFPTGPKDRIDFAALATGQFVRLRWTAIQGTYPGLQEFIAGGIPASVPEPGALALLGLGLIALGGLRLNRR